MVKWVTQDEEQKDANGDPVTRSVVDLDANAPSVEDEVAISFVPGDEPRRYVVESVATEYDGDALAVVRPIPAAQVPQQSPPVIDLSV